MNKAELVAEVCLRADVTRHTAENCIEATFDAIASAMAQGDEIRVTGFGIFASRDQGARTVRNPRTGEVCQIAPRRYPTFRAYKSLRLDLSDAME